MERVLIQIPVLRYMVVADIVIARCLTIAPALAITMLLTVILSILVCILAYIAALVFDAHEWPIIGDIGRFISGT